MEREGLRSVERQPQPNQTTHQTTDMAKRTYHRRSDEELIADLQEKLKSVENRMQAKTRTDAAVLKQLPKVSRQLRNFAQIASDNRRDDLSNMTIAFLAGLQRAAEEVREDASAKSRARREGTQL